MRFDNRITSLLDVEVPIVQAPMGFIARSKLASAVSNAGALGIIGQGLFSHGIGLGETSFVMPFDYMRIVYAFFLGIIWFSEVPGIWSFAGAGVIIAASVYLLRTENQKKAIKKDEEAGDVGAPKA